MAPKSLVRRLHKKPVRSSLRHGKSAATKRNKLHTKGKKRTLRRKTKNLKHRVGKKTRSMRK